jgi:hypothetical protein
MNKSERKEWMKKRKIVVDDLKKLEKKYGAVLLKDSMIFKIEIDRQRSKTESEIARLEGELKQLKRGKRLY